MPEFNWDVLLDDSMPRRTHSRHGRDEDRKRRKERRRKQRIESKMRELFSGCAIGIVNTDILTTEELEFLKGQYREAVARRLDYWPISKRINNKIRRYAHKHKATGLSLHTIICSDRLTINNLIEGSYTMTYPIDYVPFI